MAAEIGISGSTLVRIERGEVPNGSTMAKVLRWLLKERDELDDTTMILRASTTIRPAPGPRPRARR